MFCPMWVFQIRVFEPTVSKTIQGEYWSGLKEANSANLVRKYQFHIEISHL